MSLLSKITDRLIVQPVAKRMITEFAKSSNNSTPQSFQVPIGFNDMRTDANRRQTTGAAVSYQILRALSQQHETTRAAITIRKRQITQLDYDVVDMFPERGKTYTDEQRYNVKKALMGIGGPGVRFRNLLDKLIEDVLVLDALCFYKQKTRGNTLYRIIPIDPATIKLRVDEAGLRPQPPEVAFEQWIRGEKVADMTMEEMVYESMNPRTTSPYGLSPIEGMITSLDASMRAMLYNLSYLSDNNVPQGFLTMPENWTPNQIKEYKEYFDAMVSSPKEQAKVYPIPSGSTYQATTKPSDFSFKDFFDYLDRRVCMMFDLTPQELGLNLQQYKENADSQEHIQMRKGVKPLAHFLEEIFSDIIQQDFGFDELTFKFAGLETKFNYDDVKTLIPLGVVGIDEVRTDMGLGKLGVEPFVVAGNQIIPVTQIGKTTISGTETPSQDTPQLETPEIESKKSIDAELKAWETKAINDIKKKGKVYRVFTSNIISEELKKTISDSLETAETIEDVKKSFDQLKKKDSVNPLDLVEEKKKYKEFQREIEQLLIEQIKPFTDTNTIDQVTETKKDYVSDISANVDILLNLISEDQVIAYITWAAKQGVQNAERNLSERNLEIKTGFDLKNEDFVTSLEKRSQYLIKSVNETTKEWLVNQITNGKKAGLTNEEVAQQISDAYPEISANRADTIVRTEVANAMQNAELEVYQEEKVPYKKWVLSENIDDVCGANAEAGAIKINQTFPSGDLIPPAHPNCRCFIQAVFEEDL